MRGHQSGTGAAVAEVPRIGMGGTGGDIGEGDLVAGEGLGAGDVEIGLSRLEYPDLLARGIASSRPGYGEGDGVGAGSGVAVRGHRSGAGIAVAEVPGVGGDFARGAIGKGDDLADEGIGEGDIEVGEEGVEYLDFFDDGVGPPRSGDGEGEGVGACAGVGVAGILFGTGAAVAEAPGVGGDFAEGAIGNGDGLADEGPGAGEIEVGEQRFEDLDQIGPGLGADAARSGDGEGNGVEAGFGIGVCGMNGGAGIAVAKAPGGSIDETDRGIGEAHGERGVAARIGRGENGFGWGVRNGDVADLGLAVGASEPRGGEGDGVDTGFGIGVGGIDGNVGVAVAEAPGKGIDVAGGLIGEGHLLADEELGAGCREGGLCRGEDLDDIGLDCVAGATRSGDGEGDRIGARRVGVRWAGVGTGVAVAEVPAAGADLAGGLVGKTHGQRGHTGDVGCGEPRRGRRKHDVDIVAL